MRSLLSAMYMPSEYQYSCYSLLGLVELLTWAEDEIRTGRNRYARLAAAESTNGLVNGHEARRTGRIDGH